MENINQPQVQQEESGISLKTIFFLIKRYILLIIAITGLATVATGVYGLFFKPYSYTSTATVLVEAETSSNQTESTTYSLSVNLVNSFADFIKKDPVCIEAANILKNEYGYEEIAPESIKRCISISTETYSVFIEVKAKTSDQQYSADIANAVVKAAQNRANALEADGVTPAYEILNGKLKLVEDAKKETGTRGASTVILIGFAAGLVASFIVIFILYTVDDTFTSREEFEKAFGLNVLSCIPDAAQSISGGKK